MCGYPSCHSQLSCRDGLPFRPVETSGPAEAAGVGAQGGSWSVLTVMFRVSSGPLLGAILVQTPDQARLEGSRCYSSCSPPRWAGDRLSSPDNRAACGPQMQQQQLARLPRAGDHSPRRSPSPWLPWSSALTTGPLQGAGWALGPCRHPHARSPRRHHSSTLRWALTRPV